MQLGFPRLTLRGHLLVLVLAALVPMIALGAVLTSWLVAEQRKAVTHGPQGTAEALALAVDREIAANISALEMLATSPEIDRGDLVAFHDRARLILGKRSHWANIALEGEMGQILVHTARAPGTVLPRAAHLEAIERVRETRQPVVSDLVVGAVAGRPMIPITVPVLRDGRPRYTLTAMIAPDSWSAMLAEIHRHSAGISVALDGKGRVLARNRDPDAFLGRPGPDWLVAARESDDTGLARGAALDGQEVVAAFQASRMSGWTLFIGAPRGEIEERFAHTLATAAGLGAVLLIASFMFAAVAARRISRPLVALEAAGSALASGVPVSPRT